LVRAFSVVNIHFMRAREAFRWHSQAAISDARRELSPVFGDGLIDQAATVAG
jgi:hypothetical protein